MPKVYICSRCDKCHGTLLTMCYALGMSEKRPTAPKKPFDKEAFLKAAEKVAKILEKEKAQQSHA